MAVYLAPFALDNLFVNVLAGNWNIFIFLALILISAGAGLFRMPDRVYLSFVVLFGVFMAVHLGGLYALMLVLVGLGIYYGLAKLVKY
jgi:hypothetical protein